MSAPRALRVTTTLALAVALVLAALVGADLTSSTALAPTYAASAPTAAPAKTPAAASRKDTPLAGRVVVLDPGHQLGGGNFRHKLRKRVPAGGFKTACDTVPASTRGGYSEATLAWQVSQRVQKRLEKLGARVVLTRDNNAASAWGPCVDDRGRAGNDIPADLKISIHADSTATSEEGSLVIAPQNLKPWTDDIYGASLKLGKAMRSALNSAGVPKAAASSGLGRGMDLRADLATLNLSDIPTAMVELGNMRNRADARRMTSGKGRDTYARALAKAATKYLAALGAGPGTGTGGGNGGGGSSAKAALGVQVFSMWRDWATKDRLMDMVAASGSRWIRVDVGWCSLEEHGKGNISQWYIDRLDATVAAAGAHGLKLLLTLTCAPTWATPGGQEGVFPSDPAEYGRIAHWLAARYAGRVAAWEVWNEPDCMNGGCPKGDPVAYTQVLKAAYPQIKSADPAAIVMNGGLSGIDMGWIKRMYDAGAGSYLDALALHPYLAPANASPMTASTPGFTNPYRITNVVAARNMLVDSGHASTPIWFTEFGWTTGRTPGSSYDGVTPATQADYLTKAMALIRSDYPYVTNAFWYMAQDRDDSSVYENGFGLLALDGSPKPVYSAFAKANGVTLP